jgi:hypothetical protein
MCFPTFIFVKKNHKIVDNSTTVEATEQTNTDLEILEFL